jgi:PAS domain S-box-containing protein
MNYQDKSKEELIKELHDLQQENTVLKLAGQRNPENLSGGVLKPRSGDETNLAELRHTAETELKKRKDKVFLVPATEADSLKLINELEVHQIELEMQNEELLLAKQQAEEATEKYTNLYDFAPTGYFTLSNTSEIIVLNLIGAKMLGKDRSKLIKSRFGFFVSDETKLVFSAFLDRAFKSKVNETCEVGLLVDGNQPNYVHLSGIITQNGKNCLVTAVDITERKQAEEALRKSEKKLNEAHKIANLGNWQLNHVSSRLSWSEGISEMFEIDAGKFEATYESFLDAIHPEDRERVNMAYWESIKNKTPYEITHRLLMPDGRIKWVNEICRTNYNVQGNPVRSFGIVQDVTVLKQTEIQLQINEAQKNAILNGISANIAFVDKDLKIIWANKTAAESVHKTPDEMVGHTCHRFWADPSKPCENCPTLKAFATKKPEQTTITTPDGKIWEERGEPIFDTEGNLIGVVEIATDITERKQAEEEKREANARHRTLSKAIEQSPVTTVITDIAGNIQFVNPKFTETTGYTAEEAIGKNPGILKSGDKPAAEYKELWDTILSGKNWHGFFKNKKKNGEIYWESAVISPVKDEEGVITHFLAVKEDITRRKQAEEALRESEQKLVSILDDVSDVIWSLYFPDLKVYFISASVEKVFGRPVKEFTENTALWSEIVHPDDRQISDKAFEQVTKKGSAIRECRIIRPDGSIVWINDKSKIIYDKTGTPIRIDGVTRDITERKKAEEALLKSEQMLLETGRIAKLGGWEIDLATNKLTWTDETYRIHEVDPHSQPLIEDGINFYAPEAQPILKEAMARTIKEGVPFDLELPFITAKGKSLWVRSIGNAEQADGQTIRLFGVFQDITERKMAECALRESEETYRSILLASPDDITITDLEGRILMVSPATLHILRCKDENELIGHFVDEFIFQDDRERAKNNISLMFQGFMTGLGTYRGLRADGSIFEMEANAEFIRDASGQPNKILFIVRDISERKKVEKALQASEEKHRVLFENSPDAYLTILNGKYNDCNKAAENILCGAREQIIGQSPDALSPELQPDGELSEKASANRMAQAIESGFISFEWVHRRFDGSDFLAEISIGVIQIDGQPALFTVMRDITKRKKIEEALRESEEKFREMANFLPQIIFETDLQGKLTYVNKQAYKIMRYDENDPVIGLSSLEFHIPEERSRAIDNIQQKIADKTIERSEFMMLRKDGSTFPAKVYSNYYRVNDKPAGLRGLIVDISDIKKAEDLLKETNAYLENLINYANAPIIVWDPQFRITRFNHAFEFITGRTEAEVLGKSLEILFPPKLIENSMSLINKTLTGERWETVEIIIQHRNQTHRTVLWNSATLFAPDGKTPLATIAQGQDITERKKAEQEIKLKNEELRELNATKDKFFSIIAHDLKSPFNSIMGFSELLIEQIKDNDYAGIEKHAQIILDSSERAVDLLMNLMDWSRSQTGRMEFNPEDFEIVEFIPEIMVLFKDIATQKSIVIKKDLPHDCAVVADKAMINTVLRNLVSNAIKFTKPGGEIFISINQKQNEITVSVKDSGIGIPAGRIDKLFRIDENYSTPGTNNEKGTGLGLILCKEFIEKHGGKIWVESEIDIGTVFHFTIPKKS